MLGRWLSTIQEMKTRKSEGDLQAENYSQLCIGEKKTDVGQSAGWETE